MSSQFRMVSRLPRIHLESDLFVWDCFFIVLSFYALVMRCTLRLNDNWNVVRVIFVLFVKCYQFYCFSSAESSHIQISTALLTSRSVKTR